ncbi:lipase family protein (macronuclear) [Tetrahymena thermophila SB210]|uniref:Lipase family protein n=1 Tax=Tetrahymena thermophila (strain SB210) TaxID=312017 RepID=Q23K77_TETTS|nr:lipase family protein [Tetrahymena thermophila SB210]EAR96966.1 lipase family protein [Tetrahymena thermophila SB210]|eukprot:XP_001017211.1 lipase family protein [Tetrahymena thermophila SB210]
MNIKVSSTIILASLLFLGASLYCITFLNVDQYDEEFAYEASGYAQASRCSLQNIQNWSCGTACQINPGVTDIKAFYNSTHQIQGYTAYDQNKNMIIAAFRPTVTDLNTLIDLDYFQIKYASCNGCEVHRGFLLAWKDLQNQVLTSISELANTYPNAKVGVFGHSLGGALAVLASIDINNDVKHVDYLYTFGQPRVGNKKFAKYFNERIGNIYRLIHNRDLIPHVPLRVMGFYHEGTEVWYDEPNTSYEVCDFEKDNNKCSDKLHSFTMKDHCYYMGRDICEDC